MYLSASGSTFSIGSPRPGWEARIVQESDFADPWTEVDGVSSLGRISGEWGLETWVLPDDGDDDRGLFTTVQKVNRPRNSMQVIVGTLSEDEGQLAMIAAEDSLDAFGFKISLPNGESRYFIALIIGMEDVIEDGQTALGLAFNLHLQSNIVRSGPT